MVSQRRVLGDSIVYALSKALPQSRVLPLQQDGKLNFIEFYDITKTKCRSKYLLVREREQSLLYSCERKEFTKEQPTAGQEE